MKELIAKLKSVLDCPLYCQRTDDMGECVLYDFHTFAQQDGVQRVRLQITIIAGTMAKAIEKEEIIKKAILTLGDTPLSNDILQVALNGGGNLYDDARQMHHHILYFDIVKRGA